MDKLPEIKFIYSESYCRVLYQATATETEKVSLTFEAVINYTIKFGKKLENLFLEHKKEILNIIQRISGFAWNEYADPYIFIYPVYPLRQLQSFSHPLTIKVREDSVLALGILIHELAHNNMNVPFSDSRLQEQIMSTIALIVLEELSLDPKNTRAFFEAVFQERFDKKFFPLKELKTKTVRNLVVLTDKDNNVCLIRKNGSDIL